MLLVTLVVVGHSWTLFPHTWPSTWFYDYLYLWHVPAFVMVTGYLSRSFTWSRTNLRKLVTGVALPYVTFEAALAAFRVQFGGEHLNDLFADPHWPMWYLAALFMWRLATPLLNSPKALAVAVVVSLLGGLTSGDMLDTARTMGLLPFFVIGLLARREHIDLLRRPVVRVGAVVSLAVAFVLTGVVEDRIRIEWLYWRGYAELLMSPSPRACWSAPGCSPPPGCWPSRSSRWSPRRASWFSRLGAATLVVYLFHGFFVKAAQYADLGQWTVAHPRQGLLVTSALAVVLALALAAPPVARRLNVLVDPVAACLRCRAAAEASREDRSLEAQAR